MYVSKEVENMHIRRLDYGVYRTQGSCCTFIDHLYWRRGEQRMEADRPVNSKIGYRCNVNSRYLDFVKLFHISDVPYTHGCIEQCRSERRFQNCSF